MKRLFTTPTVEILLIIIQRCLVICAEEEITHSTPLGGLIGLRKQVSGKDVYQFKKIPYAKPPVGLLRFAKPQPYGSWVGTFDARYFGPSCYQQMNEAVKQTLQNQAISEDCLHLNIYVPNNLSPTSNKSVMVWIHGGGYTTGQSQSFDGSHLAVAGDVIVVTINYRLNVFGFLSHGDIKGNFGLWDQKLAIEWLNDNIESFGGNSKSITMFGQSAGGFCVGLLSTVGSNEGLFQRAILQSASPFNPRLSLNVTKSSDEEMSRHIAEYLNCSSEFSNDFTTCVQNANTSDVFNAYTSKRSDTGLFKGATIGPVIDQDLILDDPRKMLMDPTSPSSKFFNSLDLMSGTVSGESSLIIDIFQFGLQNILQFNVTDSIPKRILCNFFATDATRYNYNGNVKVSDAICNKYWQGSNQDELSNSVVDMFSDVSFHVPEVESLRLHQTRSKQKFQYTFSRRFPFSFGLPRPSWFTRVPHGGELMYLFSRVPMVGDDFNLSNQMLKYWTNFAKTGNVNGQGLPKWPEYDATEEMYLNLDVNITTGSKLYQDRVDFWLNDIPEIVNPRTTQAPSTYDPSSNGFKFQSQKLQFFVIIVLSSLLLS